MDRSTHKSTIAVLGTGLMGGPMAQNLLKHGIQVHAWNRTKQKAEFLEAHGAKIFDSPQDCVADADFIITMLSDGDAVHDLIFGQNCVAHIKRGATIIDMSSIRPQQARDHENALHARNIAHLDAPVSGGTKGAEAGTLAIMVGGKASVFDSATAILSAMGRPVHVGGVGAGQLSKLANQVIVAVTIGVVAEAMLLVQQGGANPQAMREALKGGFADSTILQQHGARMSNRDFTPGGRSVHQLKDLDNLLQEADALNLQLPLAQQLRDRFAHLCHTMDNGELDHSGLFLELLERNDL